MFIYNNKRGMRNKMNFKEYLWIRFRQRCPKCHSKLIEEGHKRIEGFYIEQSYRCLNGCYDKKEETQ